MAILQVNERWMNESINQDKDGRVDLTVGYQIIGDSPFSTLQALRDLRLPFYGAPHPEDSNLVVVDRRVNRVSESRCVAEAEIVYSTQLSAPQKTGSGGNPEDDSVGEDDPLEDEPVIEWIPIEGVKVCNRGRLRDSQGVFPDDYSPICNSAGVPYYDPPVEISDPQYQVLYRVNETHPDPIILTYFNVVNSDSFTIGGIPIEPGEALMKPPRIGAADYRSGTFYVPITYELRLRPQVTRTGGIASGNNVPISFRGWEIELQDRGFHYFNGSGDLVRATDDEGNEMVEPVFLDGSGGLADPPESSPARVYKILHELPFGIFNFQ